ncbi:MAG: DUF1501 domain-containing protein [Rhodospirillaceae bacterium]|nr:DUF1501 domain-containing protein [Rhodospirillaceae bacterium]
MAFTAAPMDRRLVMVILRGGADGLALVPAPGDPNFDLLRRGLFIQDLHAGNIDLDGFFALHPKLTGLASLWAKGQLAVVHATQTGYRNRSHFDAQDLLENGLNTVSALADGWLNRALGYFGRAEPRTGLAVGYGTPLILQGQTPIATWAPRRLARPDPDYLNKLMVISSADPAISKALDQGIRSEKANRQRLGHLETSRGGTTSRRAIAGLAEAAGRLLSAKTGARVAALNIGGWDTHGYQNTALSYRMATLDGALMGLRAGLGPAWENTMVLVVTEFGRTAVPNGTNGTDHGTGSAMLLLGGAVRGGRVLADWPGLGKNDLYQGRDLKPTTDMRAVFKGVMMEHLGLDQAFVEDRVFPDSRAVQPLMNLVRTV